MFVFRLLPVAGGKLNKSMSVETLFPGKPPGKSMVIQGAISGVPNFAEEGPVSY